MNDSGKTLGRHALFDVIRGVAILLMIVYHFSWDLTFFGLADFHIFTDSKWIWFARFIVIMILGIMGVSQVMARRKPFTSRIFLKRWLRIAAAAAAVSAATWFLDPTTYIFFGILHHIALASVLLVGAVLLPSWLLLALASVILAAQYYFVDPMFAPNWLLWIGLSPSPAAAVDYVPLVPWFSVPLLGIVAGRWFFQSSLVLLVQDWQPSSLLLNLVRLAGRHSLAVYLIHQPVLYGGLWGVMALIGPD